MPNCNHPGATCVIGQFYTCTTRGCPNDVSKRQQPVANQDPNVVYAYMAYPTQHQRIRDAGLELGQFVATSFDMFAPSYPYGVRYSGHFKLGPASGMGRNVRTVTVMSHDESILIEYFDYDGADWVPVNRITQPMQPIVYDPWATP